MRDVRKQPLTAEEVRALGKKLGGVRELVAPTRRKETEHLTDEQLVVHLAATPQHLRRPLIDTGRQVTAGFTARVREALEAEWTKR